MIARDFIALATMLLASACSQAAPIDACAPAKERYAAFRAEIAPQVRKFAGAAKDEEALAQLKSYPRLKDSAEMMRLMDRIVQEQRRYEIAMRECGGGHTR